MKSPETIAELHELSQLASAGRAHLDFLPAAIEIVERPASRYARTIALTIIGFFVFLLVWSWFGKVDIVASADGKIVPAGQVKTIQPLESGVVKRILVSDGEHVTAGEVLLELDGTATMAEEERIAHDLVQARLDISRLEALLDPNDTKTMVPTTGASPDAVAAEIRMLVAQRQERQAKLAVIDRELDQKRAETEGARATVAKLNATIPLLARGVAARKELFDRQNGSLFSYLELQQNLVGQQHELVVQQHRIEELEQAVEGLKRQHEETLAGARRDALDQLLKIRQQEDRLVQEAIKARQKTSLQTLTAPVSGTVQQLAVHTIGGVVTPAQPVLVIVPDDLRLEVEARVPNRDVGFVAPGQEAEIKIAAFDFTRYGVFRGKVTSVSRDALTPTEQTSDRRELYYAAHVSLDRTHVEADGRTLQLTPGMMTSVEIKTGRRRLLDYILSPVMRYREGSMRER